jgi:predicted nucleic acid-binding protein
MPEEKRIKIYLDNCCYNRPYDDQHQIRILLETEAKLYIQQLIVQQKLGLVISYMSCFENDMNPNGAAKESISAFFQNSVLFYDESNSDTAGQMAKTIMSRGIKQKDALHLACAIQSHCDYFITTDDEIIKKSDENEINVINPIGFIRILEEKNA